MASTPVDAGTKSVKVPMWDGGRDTFQVWWIRFRAFARAHGFVEALNETPDPKLPVESASTTDTDSAVYYLTLAFESGNAMKFLFKGMTNDHPNGNSSMIVKALVKRFRPDDEASKMEFIEELHDIKMGKNESPAVLFTKIAMLQNRYGMYKTGDAHLSAAVMKALPLEYKAVVTTLRQSKGGVLSYDELEDCLEDYYRTTRGTTNKIVQKVGDTEITFTSIAGKPGTKCWSCGGADHVKKDCPKLKNKKKGGKTSNGKKCANCNKEGHDEASCWMKPENASKRPQWLKDKLAAKKESRDDSEVVNIGLSKSKDGYEFLGCGVDVEVLMQGVDKQLFPSSLELLKDPNIWIADTGATVDMTPHEDGITDAKPSNVMVHVGNGQYTPARHSGLLRVTVCNNTGKDLYYGTLPEMHHVPESPFNVVSLTQRIENGWELGGNKYEGIYLEKNGVRLPFDIRIETTKGVVWAACLKRQTAAVPEVYGAAPTTVTKLSVQQAHNRLGHMGEDLTRKSSNALGWQLTRGSMTPCESCAIGKGRQKNIPKDSGGTIATMESQRAYLDCCSFKDKETHKVTNVWRLMVVYPTQLKITNIFKTKAAMVEPTVEAINTLLRKGVKITKLRMDNAGENKALATRMQSQEWKLPIDVEWTARDTPQQNSPVEVGFATLGGRARSMIADANVPQSERRYLMPEAVKTATLLDNLIPIEIDGKKATRYEHHFGENPPFASSLRTWGEAGTVTIKSRSNQAKDTDRGVTCMMVGYSLQHPSYTYRMYNPITKGVHITRDVTWLRRMYYTKARIPMIEAGEGSSDDTQPENPTVSIEEILPEEEAEDPNQSMDVTEVTDDDDDDEQTVPSDNRTGVLTGVATGVATRTGRMVYRPLRLDEDEKYQVGVDNDSYQIHLTEAEERYYKTMETCYSMIDETTYDPYNELINVGVGTGFENTIELHTLKYDQAMASDDKDKWMKAIEAEHQNMVNNKVWEPVEIKDVPKNATILSSTWVFKKKANGTYKGRLTARGYEQRDGEHYDSQDKSSPVATDITIRIILTMIVMACWWSELIDVKGAFLTAEFEPQYQMYVDVPKGFEKYYPANVVLLLLRTLYGTKQAAIQFWKKLCAVMRIIGATRSKADVCLYYAYTLWGLVLMVSWVDDILICGRKKGVVHMKSKLRDHFKLDETGEMKEYVGCKVEHNKEEKWMKLTQPVMIRSFQDEFDLPNESPTLPAPPGEILTKDDGELLDKGMATTYRSGTGKLLHMKSWSRNDIQNRVRELSRFMSYPTTKHLKSMYRVMNYVCTSQLYGNFIKPNQDWNPDDKSFEFKIRGRSDSEYATDPETRRSISGGSVFLFDAPIMTRSRMQKCVTLSVTEAEFVSGVDTAQDMLFAMRVIESIGLKVEKPMVLEMDNKGAVDLINSWSATGRTRHIASRINFMRELKEEGLIAVRWISNIHMSSNIFTKNVGGADFVRHRATYVQEGNTTSVDDKPP